MLHACGLALGIIIQREYTSSILIAQGSESLNKFRHFDDRLLNKIAF